MTKVLPASTCSLTPTGANSPLVPLRIKLSDPATGGWTLTSFPTTVNGIVIAGIARPFEAVNRLGAPALGEAGAARLSACGGAMSASTASSAR